MTVSIDRLTRLRTIQRANRRELTRKVGKIKQTRIKNLSAVKAALKR